VLHNGDEAYPAMLAAIDEARSSVALCSYIFGDDAAGRPFVDALARAAKRGVEVRVLTGDYLGITAPEALRALLDLTAQFTTMTARVVHCEGRQSFHAKAYIFTAGAETAAYVGSSNLSHVALTTGIEWNLRAVSRAQAGELAAIRAGFDRLWRSPAAKELTAPWVDEYAARPRPPRGWDPPPPSPEPHAIQLEALAALRAAWAAGARRGLVVLATGLGKTRTAAEVARRRREHGRVLWLAHREELLTQAGEAMQEHAGLSTELERAESKAVVHELMGGADVVVASVATLHAARLRRWPSNADRKSVV
jgi:HKD family nuclease